MDEFAADCTEPGDTCAELSVPAAFGPRMAEQAHITEECNLYKTLELHQPQIDRVTDEKKREKFEQLVDILMKTDDNLGIDESARPAQRWFVAAYWKQAQNEA